MTPVHQTLETSAGNILYRDQGHGSPILFVHGFLMNGDLWEQVVSRMPSGFRLLRPDLPLGGHRVSAEQDADLSLLGIAQVVLEIIERLDLHDVTLVGNDTGGAVCQVVITRQDERVQRIGRVFLTNCDAFECFPPMSFALLRALAGIHPTMFSAALGAALRLRLVRRAFFWSTAARQRSDDEMLAFLDPFIRDPDIRRDAMKVLLAMAPRYTLDAAARFPQWKRPVSIMWGLRDIFFPVSLGERMVKVFPDASIERVAGARLFIALDEPAAVANALSNFASHEAKLLANTRHGLH